MSSATGEVVYTPPPANELPGLLSNWEQFVNITDDGIDPLAKAAIAHYQFEAIRISNDHTCESWQETGCELPDGQSLPFRVGKGEGAARKLPGEVSSLCEQTVAEVAQTVVFMMNTRATPPR